MKWQLLVVQGGFTKDKVINSLSNRRASILHKQKLLFH